MKRYSPVTTDINPGVTVTFRELPHGFWVTHADALAFARRALTIMYDMRERMLHENVPQTQYEQERDAYIDTIIERALQPSGAGKAGV